MLWIWSITTYTTAKDTELKLQSIKISNSMISYWAASISNLPSPNISTRYTADSKIAKAPASEEVDATLEFLHQKCRLGEKPGPRCLRSAHHNDVVKIIKKKKKTKPKFLKHNLDHALLSLQLNDVSLGETINKNIWKP